LLLLKLLKKRKTKKGEIIQDAIPEIPAKPESSEVYVKCVSEEVARECCARLEDQGFEINYEGLIFEDGGGFLFSFTATAKVGDPKGTATKIWRKALKACKAKDGYNAPGLVILEKRKKRGNQK
jgi:hypothetical protein